MGFSASRFHLCNLLGLFANILYSITDNGLPIVEECYWRHLVITVLGFKEIVPGSIAGLKIKVVMPLNVEYDVVTGSHKRLIINLRF